MVVTWPSSHQSRVEQTNCSLSNVPGLQQIDSQLVQSIQLKMFDKQSIKREGKHLHDCVIRTILLARPSRVACEYSREEK